MPPSLGPKAGGIVCHAQGQQNEQEEDRAHDDQSGEFFVRVFYVHEEQHDEDRLESGDAQRDDRVEGTHIHESGSNGESRENKKGQPNRNG